MASDYIPGPDAQALEWMQAFSAGITASPSSFDLVGADATAIAGVVTAFDAALTIALNPATRTEVTINDKDEARASAEQLCRQYASQIKVNVGVSNSDKISIGVRPVNTSRTPVPPPSTSPLLNIVLATPGVQTLRYADSASPDSGKKAPGSTSLQLFVAVGTAAVTDPADAVFRALYTKNPVEVPFEADDDGKIATYFGRWATRTGEVGPWSLPVSMRIAA